MTSQSPDPNLGPDPKLGGYDPNAGFVDTDSKRPRRIAVPSLLRSLLTDHLDPGYAAAARLRERTGRRRKPAVDRLWQAVAALVIAVVFAAAVAQARATAPGVSVAQQVLAESVRSAEGTADRLTARRNVLSTQSDEIQRRQLRDDSTGRSLLARLDQYGLAAASTAVTGPGLNVSVADPITAPDLTDVSKQRVQGSRQVILDRDLQLVVNSLWVSGAEAISVGGVRIGPNVTIRQAGGAILVDNHPISSPYAVLAIGDREALMDGFGHSSGLLRMRLLETAYGVAVNVSTSDGLSLPAGTAREIKFAKQLGR